MIQLRPFSFWGKRSASVKSLEHNGTQGSLRGKGRVGEQFNVTLVNSEKSVFFQLFFQLIHLLIKFRTQIIASFKASSL